jgi:hypothetical protein
MSRYPDDFDRDDPDRAERERGGDRRDRRDDEDDIRAAKGRVTAPAIGLIVVALLMLLATVLILVQYPTLDAQFDAQIDNIEKNPQLPPDQKKEQVRMMNDIRGWVKAGMLPYIGVLGVTAVVILVGGIKLMTLGSPGLVYLASVLAMLPLSCCCLLGLVFGLWAIIAMGNPTVKAGFAARRRAARSPDSY